jgi:tetratricopeptide (TPR) repeat protein
LLLALAGTLLFAQETKKETPPPKAAQDLPEEDENLKPPADYAFNPVQATKEITVGNYYFKQKKYRAAAGRFLEATRWNPGLAEAFLRLGVAREKLRDKAGAQEAYAKYLELAPDAKDADEIRRKLGKASASAHK